jgi:peptidylprolyl isomerase domain and WD repeat-containing protein 1
MSDKRKLNQDDDDSSDDDFGPMPAPASECIASIEEPAIKKTKVRSLKFENVYLDNLPSAEQYEHSYMHRDIVTHISVAKTTDFIITGSFDGHVKFWKKMGKDIEFVKHYHAHLGPISSLEITNDGQKLVTTSSEDSMIKIFDVQSFDMANMISVNYKPTSAVWLNSHHSGHFTRVSVADADSGNIRIYKSEGSQEPITTINIHSSPVKCMVLNAAMCCVISADARGVLEYWDVDSFVLPNEKLSFKYKTETDLYDLAKKKTTPCSIAVSQQGNAFATTSRDKQIRVFDFSSGKLRRQYDETNTSYQVRIIF